MSSLSRRIAVDIEDHNMQQNPAVYWRKQQQSKNLLGKTGTILAVTKVEGHKHYTGIIKIDNKNHTAAIIATTRQPQTGDQVIGVLRLVKQNGADGLLEYGIKFQLIEEV